MMKRLEIDTQDEIFDLSCMFLAKKGYELAIREIFTHLALEQRENRSFF